MTDIINSLLHRAEVEQAQRAWAELHKSRGQDDEEFIHAEAVNGHCPDCEPLFLQPPAAAPAPAGELVAWADADAICNAPDVDEAIRTLLDDQTGDNAVEVVRAILRYAQPAAARVPQDQRAAFEAWVKVDSTLPVDRDCFDYKDFTVALLWHAWQAAQKANAPGGALVGDDDANGRPGLAGADSTCRHEFALQPSSGIKLCTHCGLSEVAARKTAAARVTLTDEQLDRAVAAWFEGVAPPADAGQKFRTRMRAAIEAASREGGAA
jgi:hypothetical protein